MLKVRWPHYVPVFVSVAVVIFHSALTFADECTAQSGTACRLVCALGQESLSCPPQNPSRCSMHCRAANAPAREPAACKSGSGTECKLTCDEGTFSLACSQAGRTCKGRCRNLSSRAAFVAIDTVLHLAKLGFTETRGTTQESQNKAGELDQGLLREWFRDLVTDIYDALPRDRRRDVRPSAIAFALYDSLTKSTAVERTTTVDVDVKADKLTLRLGIPVADIPQLRHAVEPLLEDLQKSDRVQREFDGLVEQQLRNEQEAHRKP